MAQWVEVTEGDMQRMQENAWMFRCSMQHEFAFLATKLNDHLPFDPERSMECYGRDANGVEWYCDDMKKAEFDALTIDKVGVNDAPAEPTPPPDPDPAVWSIYDPDTAQFYSQELDQWVGITNATRYTGAEKDAMVPFPPEATPNAYWRELPPL